MIPMNGVLRGLCSATAPWPWGTLLSLSRTSGPSAFMLSEQLLAELKLLAELAGVVLLDGELGETPLAAGLCCLASLKFIWAEAASLSAGLDLLAKEREESLSWCCEWEHWLDANFSLYSSELEPVGTLPDGNVLVASKCWVLEWRPGKGLWGRCWKDDCVFVWHWLLPGFDPGWLELRCWLVLTIWACFVGCMIKPGSLRNLLPVLLCGDTDRAFCWTPPWRVLLCDEAAKECCSLCGEETDSSQCGSSSSLSWRLKLSFTPCIMSSSSLSELVICCSSCGDWCFCCCVLWSCLQSSSTRAKRRFISWLLGHSCVASRKSARAASSFLLGGVRIKLNKNLGQIWVSALPTTNPPPPLWKKYSDLSSPAAGGNNIRTVWSPTQEILPYSENADPTLSSPEVQGSELAVRPPRCPEDPELHHFTVTAAKAALELPIPHQTLLVCENKVHHSTSPRGLLYRLEREVALPCCPTNRYQCGWSPPRGAGPVTVRLLQSVYRGLVCSVFLVGWPIADRHCSVASPCLAFNPDPWALSLFQLYHYS